MRRLRHPFFRTVAGVTVAALLGSCATTHVPPISSMGASFQPERDEVRLWEQSRDEEAKLAKNVTLYHDPLLVDYLEQVMNRIEPPGMAANTAISYRVAVIEDPTLNAFAYPTGSVYVHTGLLARMENEDQLATVLGHEMTHVEDRHMLRYQRGVRNRQIGFGIAAIAGSVVIAGEQGRAASHGAYGKAARIGVLANLLLGLGLTLAIIASVNGYGRELEREADDGGFEKMAAAGYDVREAPKVYEALMDDHGEKGKAEAFFFGSHPRLSERIESAQLWAEQHPGEIRSGPAPEGMSFERRMRAVVRDDARLNLEMGRLQLAEDELNRAIGLLPEDPEAHFLMGRLRLAQMEASKDEPERARLRAAAADAFREAIRLDPELPGPHREIGLIAWRDGDFATACAEFGLYLETDPKAEDAQSIRDYRLEMKRDGRCPDAP